MCNISHSTWMDRSLTKEDGTRDGDIKGRLDRWILVVYETYGLSSTHGGLE